MEHHKTKLNLSISIIITSLTLACNSAGFNSKVDTASGKNNGAGLNGGLDPNGLAPNGSGPNGESEGLDAAATDGAAGSGPELGQGSGLGQDPGLGQGQGQGPEGGAFTTSNNNSDGSTSPGGIGTQQKKCGPNQPAINYNIQFIFDKTLSQLTTDPNTVRRSGALQFLSQLESYLALQPQARIYISVLSFNTSSIRLPHGWLLLNKTNVELIKQDIITATSNPFGFTSYSPVLADSLTFFNQVNQQQGSTNARNYAVFLTDGLPNIDTSSAISSAVDRLVNEQKVAMIAVAAGPQVPASGESQVSSMAQPQKPTQFPDHFGRYYRAANDNALANVWKGLFSNIGGCVAP